MQVNDFFLLLLRQAHFIKQKLSWTRVSPLVKTLPLSRKYRASEHGKNARVMILEGGKSHERPFAGAKNRRHRL
jgi:hypothetical protein